MRKKLLSMILITALVFSNMIMLSGVAVAESGTILDNPTADASGTLCEGISYNYVHSTKTLTLSGSGVIPDYYWTTAPFKNLDINKLVFSEGITSVGKYLVNNSKIKGVEISSTVTHFGGVYTGYAVLNTTTIGTDGFTVASGNGNFCALDGSLYSKDMKTLYKFGGNKTSYTTPRTVSLVAYEAFYAVSLDTLTFGGDNSIWNDYAVRNCKIKHLIFNEGVKSLSDYFGVDPNVLEDTEVTLAASMVDFGGAQGLLNNSKIESIKVADGSATFKSKDGVLYSKDGTKLFFYPTGKKGDTYVTPDEVTTITNGAFAINNNNNNLKHITLGENVTSIDDWGMQCRLDTLTFLSDTTVIASEAFNSSKYPAKIYGNTGSTAETFANSNSIIFEAIPTYTLNGTVISGEWTKAVLKGKNCDKEFTNDDNTFSFSSLKPGNYTLTIVAANECVSRDYEIGIGNDTTIEARVFVHGDANGNDVLDAADVTQIARHISRLSIERDAYFLKLMDTDNSGGNINAADATNLARILAGVISL